MDAADMISTDEAAALAIVEAFKWVGLEHDGTIEYQYNGRTLGKVNLVATKDINQAGFGHVFSQLLNHFFKH